MDSIVRITASYTVHVSQDDVKSCRDHAMTDSQKVTMLAKRAVINGKVTPDGLKVQ